MVDLKNARILISNDDGIDAPGIRLLEKLACSLSDDVWVVAPTTEQSGAGHSLTLRHPLRIRKRDERHFSVDGTPTDCVLLALQQIMRDSPPDIVLSGINRGGNLGEDVTYSGTVAAAMEATLLNVPAIAFSQFFSGNLIDWSVAEKHLLPVAETLIHTTWPRGVLINVNFPEAERDGGARIEVSRQGQRKIGDHIAERLDPRGEPYYWIGAIKSELPKDENADLRVIERGDISVTPISLDFTHYETHAKLTKAFP
ncbi:MULTISPECIES: 5'/3'-nucleotidase SurE [Thalassospira]|jgi:5'-nucleotidase|uniref:5'-nucleotidase SurE n=1 Tax=Thalassospira xiamenensis M-5 = DSM 17429 TaxID=1123366 RepID=A0AB72UCV1_9PROT|nr:MULTISPECIES: 5'/3'-nucleotidase SurE [Thalassospira]AJD52020.1 5'(3')-nucleotidase/polyphosphatase [Thalassospira xiamenensis M-5 = DSM 17429]MAB31986.1 5'/3'-nucleotidase SurE [Thalassospira sp.]MDM7975341.1 5'/3'-nucleotidase SurE [Thalassospira xiamenensis]OHZ00885.1 5'/3'-nucleotidase SurE [Thalassospira sp. MIT1004]RCK42952.1 stationary phase survival protein SurE [Thalassospira xiamenensis]|tara:strand:- start:268 stop:1035 length:768 start_codon:yes stop_codon:yes gene_type:complete